MGILWFYVWFLKACAFHLWKKYRTCSSFKDNSHTLLSTTLKSGAECLWQLERGLSECPEIMHLCCIYTCITGNRITGATHMIQYRFNGMSEQWTTCWVKRWAPWKNPSSSQHFALPLICSLLLCAAVQHLSLILHLSSPVLSASLFVSLWAMESSQHRICCTKQQLNLLQDPFHFPPFSLYTLLSRWAVLRLPSSPDFMPLSPPCTPSSDDAPLYLLSIIFQLFWH